MDNGIRYDGGRWLALKSIFLLRDAFFPQRAFPASTASVRCKSTIRQRPTKRQSTEVASPWVGRR
jgi:hypothetical protein